MSHSDTELLEQWKLQRDAEAFHSLIQRHSKMVYATCLRILKNSHDAEEVTQDCFASLSHVPATTARYLGPWLHRVALNRCLDRVKTETRRRAREKMSADETNVQAPVRWDDLQDFVDEAIAALPEKERAAIVEHFLEGRTQAAIADEWGVTQQAVSHRIKKGIDSIRDRLRKQGIPVATALLGILLTENASATMPAALTAGLAKLALAGATYVAPSTAPVTAGCITFKTIIGGLAVKKTILGIGAGLALILVMGGLIMTRGFNLQTPKRTLTDTGIEPSTIGASIGAASARESELLARIQFPSKKESILMSATISKQVVGLISCDPNLEPGEIADPKDYASISGTVKDLMGQPVGGALVTVTASGLPHSFKPEDSRTYERSVRRHILRTTSKTDGTYTISDIPFENQAIVAVVAPGYGQAYGEHYRLNVKAGAHLQGVDLAVEPGRTFKGVVLSPSKAPVADAIVICTDPGFALVSRADGTFSLGFPAIFDEASFVVYSPEYGRSTFTDVLLSQDAPLELVMAGTTTLRGRITAHDGAPAAGYTVQLEATGVGESMPSYKSVTNVQGEYSVEGIECTRYSVRVIDTGGAPASKILDLGFLQAGQSHTWDCALIEPTRVYGVVRGMNGQRPLPSKHVVWATDGRIMGDAITDEKGHYELKVFNSPGQHVVVPMGTKRPTDQFLTEVWTAYEKALHIVPGYESEIDLVLPDTFTAVARFLDRNDQPVTRGILVEAYTKDAAGVPTCEAQLAPDSSGGYRWDGFTTGMRCVMFARPEDDSLYAFVQTPEFQGDATGQGVHITTHLYERAQAEGRLLGADGAPIVGARLLAILHLENGETHGPVSAPTRLDGSFRMAMVPNCVDTTIPATSFRMSIFWADADAELWTWWSGPLHAEPGETIQLGDIQLQRAASGALRTAMRGLRLE